MGSKNMRKIATTNNAPAAIGPYSQGVKIGNAVEVGRLPKDALVEIEVIAYL